MAEQYFQVPAWMAQWAGVDANRCLTVYVVCAKYSRKPWHGAPANCSSVYLSSIMKMCSVSKSMASKLLRSLIEASNGKLKRLEIGGHQSAHLSGHLSHFIQWTYRESVDTQVDTKVDYYHMSIPDDKPIVSKDTDCVGPFFHCKDGFNVQLTKSEYNTVHSHIGSDTDKHLARLASDSRRPGRPWRCNRVNLAKNIVARWEKDHAEAKPKQHPARTTRPGELDTSSRQEADLKELERKANERLRRLGLSGG